MNNFYFLFQVSHSMVDGYNFCILNVATIKVRI